MSAIDIHIGEQDAQDRQDDMTCAVPRADGQLGQRACVPTLASTHAGQERMVWIRRSLEDALQKRRVQVLDGATMGLKGVDSYRLYFTLDPPLQQYELPWMPAALQEVPYVGLFGEAAKMAAPTWDLPAGSPVVGGACPGATAGQSSVPVQIRSRVEKAVGQRVKLPETICQLCYATGGNYQSPHVQVGEIIRYWWSRAMTAADEDWERARGTAWRFTEQQEEWIRTVVRALQGESWKPELKRDPHTNAVLGPHLNPRTGKPLFPVRVHSSGDFFSHQYARCWVEVANRLPDIEFWGPTRTWAAAGWIESWAEMMPYLKHGNFSIRPSAYHTDDPAISNGGRMIPVRVMTPAGPVEEMRPETPWGQGGDPMSPEYPFTAQGTTAIYKDHDANQGRDLDAALRRGEPNSIDPRYTWSCRTYSILDDAHSCANAVAPDGNVGCRACWVHRDLTVNYTAH